MSVLHLTGTKMTDAGLAHLTDCKSLIRIVVRGTGVTPAKVEEFAKAMPQCKIEHDGGVIEPQKK